MIGLFCYKKLTKILKEITSITIMTNPVISILPITVLRFIINLGYITKWYLALKFENPES